MSVLIWDLAWLREMNVKWLDEQNDGILVRRRAMIDYLALGGTTRTFLDQMSRGLL